MDITPALLRRKGLIRKVCLSFTQGPQFYRELIHTRTSITQGSHLQKDIIYKGISFTQGIHSREGSDVHKGFTRVHQTRLR